MREYTVPIFDERTERPKGKLKIKAKNRNEMEYKAEQWMRNNPGYVADCFSATSQVVEVADLGEVKLS